MRNTFLLFTVLIAMCVFIFCNNAAQSKSLALQKAQAAKVAEDQARQERDRIAEQEARERQKLADQQAEQEAQERRKLAEERAEKAQIKTSIERVLQEDARAPRGAESVAEIVSRMRDIDTSGCPDDFRLAYMNHIHAWESMRQVESDAIAFKKAANSDGVAVEAFIRGMLGDPLGEANKIEAVQTELQREYQAAHSEIKATFNRVEDIAVQNEADLPR